MIVFTAVLFPLSESYKRLNVDDAEAVGVDWAGLNNDGASASASASKTEKQSLLSKRIMYLDGAGAGAGSINKPSLA